MNEPGVVFLLLAKQQHQKIVILYTISACWALRSAQLQNEGENDGGRFFPNIL
jgi:hypothetical protein